VAVPEAACISSLRKSDVSAIAPGIFIGTAAKPGPDEKLFEASQVTEGHQLTGRIEVDGTKGSLRWE
jgi:hypothetical protein